MNELIPGFPIFHAGRKPVVHPRLGLEVAAQTAVCYLRFRQPVKLDRLELPFSLCGRWVPSVPTHPAHLIVSRFDSTRRRWEVVRDVDLPFNPDIAGAGLRQAMPIEAMEAHFARAMRTPPHVVKLDGLTVDCLRVECDREHPVWPNHGECNGGESNVPFALLKPLKAYGETAGAKSPYPAYHPLLRQKIIQPRAPRGLQVELGPSRVFFHGRKLAVGFSLARPLLLHLGWDCYGRGQAGINRLYAGRVGLSLFNDIGGLSGPLLRTLHLDLGYRQWTGEVSVRGNQVRYQNLTCGVGVRLDAVFTVEPDTLRLELAQTCAAPMPALEAEAWRLVWNMQSRFTGTVAMPTLRSGRNGDLEWPVIFAGDGNGCLLCELERGARQDVCFQAESFRAHNLRTAGFALAPFPQPGQPMLLPRGTRRVTVRFSLSDFEPAATGKVPPTLKRYWSSAFTAFRPELGGFSNNPISAHCHVNQHIVADLIVFTRPPRPGPDPLRLAQYTIERALLDGGGYGYHRGLFLDSDPILVSAAGRLFQCTRNLKWLARIRSGLAEAVQRMLGTLGPEGLVISRSLSGNSGSYRWSSNAVDVVGFGHMDAYVNAWTYRGLQNAVALLGAAGDTKTAKRCGDRAGRLKAAFPQHLVNPKTGWVAGWRSRDGELHDYAFLWINGVALAFGLLDPPAARRALRALEALRRKVCPNSGYFGLPLNLLPIAPEDHMLALPANCWPTQPTFELYTDGSMATILMGYYLRALSSYGEKQAASQLFRAFMQGLEDGRYCGAAGTGPEFHTWDGVDSGYEGTFGPGLGILYALAVESGAITPPAPEWWPAS